MNSQARLLNQSSHEVNCEYLMIHPSSGAPCGSPEQGPVSRPEPSSPRRWSAATSGTRGQVSPASRDQHSQMSPATTAAQWLAIHTFSYKPAAPHSISPVTSTQLIAFGHPYLNSIHSQTSENCEQ